MKPQEKKLCAFSDGKVTCITKSTEKNVDLALGLMLLIRSQSGEMAERLIAAVLKTVEDLRPPGVRISLSPPYKNLTSCKEILLQEVFMFKQIKNKKVYLACRIRTALRRLKKTVTEPQQMVQHIL